MVFNMEMKNIGGKTLENRIIKSALMTIWRKAINLHVYFYVTSREKLIALTFLKVDLYARLLGVVMVSKCNMSLYGGCIKYWFTL